MGSLSMRDVHTRMYGVYALYGRLGYIYPMGTQKVPQTFRIYRQYLERLEMLLAPHENKTAFLEEALHREILRREEEAKRKVA